MVAGALVLIASAVGIGWWMRPVVPVAPPPMVAESQPPQAVAPPAPPSPVSEAPPAVVQPTPSPTVAPTPTETATTAPAAVAAQVKAAENKPVRQARPEEIPEDVRQMLQEGESALEQGNPKEALRLALKSQRTKPTTAVHSLLARAYCRMKDLTNAPTAFKKVAASEKPRVKQYCIDNEVDFF
jgi:serine/threonine-protein kinase